MGRQRIAACYCGSRRMLLCCLGSEVIEPDPSNRDPPKPAEPPKRAEPPKPAAPPKPADPPEAEDTESVARSDTARASGESGTTSSATPRGAEEVPRLALGSRRAADGIRVLVAHGNGTKSTVEARSSMTVEQLALTVAAACHPPIPPQWVRFIFGRKVLYDDKTLGECGVYDQAVLGMLALRDGAAPEEARLPKPPEEVRANSFSRSFRRKRKSTARNSAARPSGSAAE